MFDFCSCFSVKPEVVLSLKVDCYLTSQDEKEQQLQGSTVNQKQRTESTNFTLRTTTVVTNELSSYFLLAQIQINRGSIHDEDDLLYLIPEGAPLCSLYSELSPRYTIKVYSTQMMSNSGYSQYSLQYLAINEPYIIHYLRRKENNQIACLHKSKKFKLLFRFSGGVNQPNSNTPMQKYYNNRNPFNIHLEIVYEGDPDYYRQNPDYERRLLMMYSNSNSFKKDPPPIDSCEQEVTPFSTLSELNEVKAESTNQFRQQEPFQQASTLSHTASIATTPINKNQLIINQNSQVRQDQPISQRNSIYVNDSLNYSTLNGPQIVSTAKESQYEDDSYNSHNAINKNQQQKYYLKYSPTYNYNKSKQGDYNNQVHNSTIKTNNFKQGKSGRAISVISQRDRKTQSPATIKSHSPYTQFGYKLNQNRQQQYLYPSTLLNNFNRTQTQPFKQSNQVALNGTKEPQPQQNYNKAKTLSYPQLLQNKQSSSNSKCNNTEEQLSSSNHKRMFTLAEFKSIDEIAGYTPSKKSQFVKSANELIVNCLLRQYQFRIEQSNKQFHYDSEQDTLIVYSNSDGQVLSNNKLPQNVTYSQLKVLFDNIIDMDY